MKLIKNITTGVVLLSSAPYIVSAQIGNPIEADDLGTLLENIIDILIVIAVPIIVLAIIYAGFLFVTAGGNEAKLTSAKKILFWAIVGGVILIGARAIAEVVQGTVDEISREP